MNRHPRLPLGIFLTVFVMVLPLLPTAAATAASDVGTTANPVRLSASTPSGAIDPELQILATALHDATGLEFVIEFAGHEEDAVWWLCRTRQATGMRIAESTEFVYADDCGADTRLKLFRFGSSTHYSEFLVPDGSSLATLDDLAGLDWYYSDEGSISGYMVPLGMLTMAGVTNQVPMSVGGHTDAVQAVYDNSISGSPTPVFASVYGDARAQFVGDHPDVFDEVRVLAESPPIPNSPIAFGPMFPADTRAVIEAALVEMADSDSPNYPKWEASMGALYSATGLDNASPDDFDFLRSALEAADLLNWGEQFTDKVGLVDVASGMWRLRENENDVSSFYYGNPGDIPFLGDWDCDGSETPGLFRQSDAFAYLRNSNTQGIADIRFFFGNPSDIPLAGDFNGDGCDTLSIYRPSEARFYIMSKLGEDEGGLGAADYSFLFGNQGDKPVVGDWDGDGIDEIGLHRETTGLFYWRNVLNTGIADGSIFFGDPGDRFVAGDWGVMDGRDTPGVFRPSNYTFYFRFTLTEGNADSQFTWTGPITRMPIAGVFGPG